MTPHRLTSFAAVATTTTMAAIAIGVTAACGAVLTDEPNRAPAVDAASDSNITNPNESNDGGGGGGDGDTGVSTRCADRAFQPPLSIPQLSTPWDETHVTLSSDELTAYVSSTSELPYGDIFVATRPTRDAIFGERSPLTSTNSADTDEEVGALDTEELSLFFSTRTLGAVNGQLHVVKRLAKTEPFASAHTPVTTLASQRNDLAPSFSRGFLYFASNNPTFEEEHRIYEAASDGLGGFQAPVKIELGAVVGERDQFPVVSADGLELFFARISGTGEEIDIWRATRSDTTKVFQGAKRVEELVSTATDMPSWLSPDGCRLYFVSSRNGVARDVWVAKR